MKKYILILFLISKINFYSQDFNNFEKEINYLLEKRDYWHESSSEKSFDSLQKYSLKMEKLILNCTSKNPKSLNHNFKNLSKSIYIQTSDDGLFRIYSWNTLEGGTMQFYKNIFQYEIDDKVFSKINVIENYDNGCNYFEINDVVVNQKHYYVTSSVAVGSSAVFYYKAKIFSIENGILNENAKLIKTKSGMRNSLGYEIDLSSSSNKNNDDIMDYIKLIYDKKNKTIIIPLIKENGFITKQKIKYKFNGKYFEKI